MKLCTRCKQTKSKASFSKHSRAKDGLHAYCKECVAKICKAWLKKTYVPHPLTKVEQCTNCSKVREKGVRWGGMYCRSCYEKIKRGTPEIRNRINKIKRERHNQNKEIRNKKRRENHKERFKTNPSARLANRFRNLLNKLVKRKTGSAETLIGCSYKELKSYLESKFLPGMTWDNWGIKGWHIDHIYPLSKLDLTNTEQLKKAFHYTNLQPLWAEDNIRKGNSIKE